MQKTRKMYTKMLDLFNCYTILFLLIFVLHNLLTPTWCRQFCILHIFKYFFLLFFLFAYVFELTLHICFIFNEIKYGAFKHTCNYSFISIQWILGIISEKEMFFSQLWWHKLQFKVHVLLKTQKCSSVYDTLRHNDQRSVACILGSLYFQSKEML